MTTDKIGQTTGDGYVRRRLANAAVVAAGIAAFAAAGLGGALASDDDWGDWPFAGGSGGSGGWDGDDWDDDWDDD